MIATETAIFSIFISVLHVCKKIFVSTILLHIFTCRFTLLLFTFLSIETTGVSFFTTYYFPHYFSFFHRERDTYGKKRVERGQTEG